MPQDLDQKTDEEVATLVQAGDSEAFGVLMRRYSSPLMRYICHFLHDSDDAEDVIEESFIRAYRNIQSFDTSKKFSAWIYRIAHNQAINAIQRHGAKIPLLELDTLFPPSGAEDDIDPEILHHELARETETILERLEMKYREPLVLYYLQEMNYKEIAAIMHIPVSTVGIRIKRAKALLQKWITTHPAT